MDFSTKNREYLQLLRNNQDKENELTIQIGEKEAQKRQAEFRYDREIRRANEEHEGKINQIQSDEKKDIKKILATLKNDERSHIQKAADQVTLANSEHEGQLWRHEATHRQKILTIDAETEKRRKKAKKDQEDQLSNLKSKHERAQKQSDEHNQSITNRIETTQKEQENLDYAILVELNELKNRLTDLLKDDTSEESSSLQNGKLLSTIRKYYITSQKLLDLPNRRKTPQDFMAGFNYDEEKAKIDKAYQKKISDIEASCQKQKEAEEKRYEQEKARIEEAHAAALESIEKTEQIQEAFTTARNQHVNDITSRVENQISELKIEVEEVIEKIQAEKTEKLDALTNDKNALQNQLNELKQQHENILRDFLCDVKNEMNEVLKLTEAYRLQGDNVCKEEDRLPTTIPIGKILEQLENYELAKVLFETPCAEFGIPITLDLRSELGCRGNVVINNANNLITDNYLDSVIAGLILKYMEEFPIGSLKVGIVDQNGVYCFNALKGALSRSNKTSTSIVHPEILKRYEDIEKYLNTFGNREFPFEIHNAYTNNPTDTQMQLIVIRSGFANLCNGTDNNRSLLNLIRPLSLTPQFGIRFIIVNDFDPSAQNRSTANGAATIWSEILNTAIVLDYKDGAISYDGRPAILTTVGEPGKDPANSIAAECNKLIEKLNKQFSSTAIIPYSQIGFGQLKYPYAEDGDTEYSIHIPVGVVNGRNRFSLEFSCSGSENTPIHYTVLGSSSRGKSGLIHSMVINGSWKYTPEELEFWLFDFKDCMTSNTYKNNPIPHIRFLQETSQEKSNSYIDLATDLYSLLKLVMKEKERRANLMKKLSDQSGVTISNIGDYNSYINNPIHVLSAEHKHMPRIIVALDEPNQLYSCVGYDDRSDVKTSIEKLYSILLTQTRATGIHFVSFVHKILVGGYVSNYVDNTQGRITFGRDSIDPQELRALNNQLIHVQDHIKGLNTGECYASLSAGATPQKVKICYDSNHNQCINKISKHHEKFKSNVLIIGNNSQLTTEDRIQTNKNYTQIEYMQMLSKQNIFLSNGVSDELDFRFLLGEDRYSLNPVCVNFGQTKVGKFVVAGRKTKLRESVLAGMLLQCVARNFEYHVAYLPPSSDNIFTELLNQLGQDIWSDEAHNDAELMATYKIFKERKESARNRRNSTVTKPVFLFIDEPTKAFHDTPQLSGKSSASNLVSRSNYETIEIDTALSSNLEDQIHASLQGKDLSKFEDAETLERIAAEKQQNDGGKPPRPNATSTDIKNSARNSDEENQKRMDEKTSRRTNSTDVLSSTQMLAELENSGAQYGIFLVVSREKLTSGDISGSESLVTLVTNSMDFSDIYGASAEFKQSVTSLHGNDAHAVFISSKEEYTKIRPVVFENKQRITDAKTKLSR